MLVEIHFKSLHFSKQPHSHVPKTKEKECLWSVNEEEKVVFYILFIWMYVNVPCMLIRT